MVRQSVVSQQGVEGVSRHGVNENFKKPRILFANRNTNRPKKRQRGRSISQEVAFNLRSGAQSRSREEKPRDSIFLARPGNFPARFNWSLRLNLPGGHLAKSAPGMLTRVHLGVTLEGEEKR